MSPILSIHHPASQPVTRGQNFGEPQGVTGFFITTPMLPSPSFRCDAVSGMRQSALWIRDSRGERAISSEGYVPAINQAGLFGALPRFSRDGKSIFYLKV